MGKLNDSNLGGSSGRVGRLVVANISGFEILKHAPTKRGDKPASDKQLLIQKRMSLAGTFINSYMELAKSYFGKRRGLKSPFNLAMKNVMDNFEVDFANNQVVPHYSSIQITKGDLLPIYGATLTAPNPAAIQLSWIDNTTRFPERNQDLLQVVVAIEGNFESYYIPDMAQRGDLTAEIVLPPEYTGKLAHVWMSFLDPIAQQACNSQYLGTIAIS